MTDVVMPQMGESVVEGTVTKWLKKPGDHVKRDEPLFEISTDKVDTEIPSPAAGTLSEVLVDEGKTVSINTVVARIDDKGDGPGAAPVREEPKSEQPAAPTPAGPAEGAGAVSPLVRRMAREHNIDLRQVRGTGAGGRISKQDIEAYLASREAEPAAAAPAGTRTEPMSIMRTRIAKHMVLSKHTSAHVTTVHKVDLTNIARLRYRIKTEFQAKYGCPLTYLPFVTKAAAEALRAFPIVNASIDGDNIVYHGEVNIGIAVALEGGLIVPVVRNAGEMSVGELQRVMTDLATRARSRKLTPDEVHGGTFSITNAGSFGTILATPIINQPQAAILAVGVVGKEPVVIDDAIAIRSTCFLSLSFDHRLIDGAVAGRFTEKIRSILENWSEDVL